MPATSLICLCRPTFLPHLSLSHCLCADGVLLSAKTCPFDVRLEHAILLAFLRDILFFLCGLAVSVVAAGSAAVGLPVGVIFLFRPT